MPFFGDQPFWGAMVERAGAGPAPIPYKTLTAQGLADAILFALKAETLERAKELGQRIREEKGCEAGAASFHAQMDVASLRCMMAPQRVAVWRVKTKGNAEDIRLSAFAATVLGNEGILDINQLKLYRPCEYEVEESMLVSNFSGPNPISGAVGSFASGLLHWPVNLVKAYANIVRKPYKGAKEDGWRGFGKGLGKGLGGVLFFKKGLIQLGGKTYGMRAAYYAIKKKMGSSTLSFILAAHFTQGFEEVQASTEESRQDILRKWGELKPDLRREQTGSSSASLMPLSTFPSSTSASTSVSNASTGDSAGRRE